jgi:hypothetical protein
VLVAATHGIELIEAARNSADEGAFKVLQRCYRERTVGVSIKRRRLSQ